MVKVRAEAMQKASELIPSGMLSVMGRPQAKYKHACLQAREHCLSLGIKEPVCSVANYLFPDGRVIAGHKEVVDGWGAIILLSWVTLLGHNILALRTSHLFEIRVKQAIGLLLRYT